MHSKWLKITWLYFFLYLIMAVRGKDVDNLDSVIKNDDYTVAKIIRRPETYYTQGLFFDDNDTSLVESGGLYGESVLVKMDYPTLKIKKKINISPKFFAEGVAICGNNVYQLTWQEKKILKYSHPELKFIDSIEIPFQMKEGWGLSESSNSNELISTDGTNQIFFLDCKDDLKVLRILRIKLDNHNVPLLNSLTHAEGFIWANKYFDNRIFKIHPETGKVIKTYNMSPLVDYEIKKNTLTNNRFTSGDVLNGITYNKTNKKFLLTGKRWGHYYEINFDN